MTTRRMACALRINTENQFLRLCGAKQQKIDGSEDLLDEAASLLLHGRGQALGARQAYRAGGDRAVADIAEFLLVIEQVVAGTDKKEVVHGKYGADPARLGDDRQRRRVVTEMLEMHDVDFVARQHARKGSSPRTGRTTRRANRYRALRNVQEPCPIGSEAGNCRRGGSSRTPRPRDRADRPASAGTLRRRPTPRYRWSSACTSAPAASGGRPSKSPHAPTSARRTRRVRHRPSPAMHDRAAAPDDDDRDAARKRSVALAPPDRRGVPGHRVSRQSVARAGRRY